MPSYSKNGTVDLPTIEEVQTELAHSAPLIPQFVRDSPLFNPYIWGKIEEIRKLTYFQLSEPENAAFLRFHSYFNTTPPDFLVSWKEDEKKKKWLATCQRTIADTKSAFTATRYHLENLRRIELQIVACLNEQEVRNTLGNSTLGIQADSMNFEYEAFVLSFRRCLDYLAGGLSAFLRIESNNFRKFPKQIQNAKMRTLAASLIEVHKEYSGALSFVLDEGRASTRNRIAHYETVPAGVINVCARGCFIAGGGEEITPDFTGPTRTLAEIFEDRVATLHRCLEAMTDMLIAKGGV